MANRSAPALLLTVVALAATFLVAGTSAAAEVGGTTPGTAPTPQLSIAVDDGHTTTVVGDTLDYTVTIRNLGPTAVTALRITQTTPPGLDFVSADLGGVVRSGAVEWDVDLDASGQATRHTTMKVVTTPDDLLRLASVACAITSVGAAPVVCASHSDQLPAGAVAEANRTAESSSDAAVATATSSNDAGRLLLGAGIVLLLAVVAVAVVLLRRRRTGAPATEG